MPKPNALSEDEELPQVKQFWAKRNKNKKINNEKQKI